MLILCVRRNTKLPFVTPCLVRGASDSHARPLILNHADQSREQGFQKQLEQMEAELSMALEGKAAAAVQAGSSIGRLPRRRHYNRMTKTAPPQPATRWTSSRALH